MERDELKGGVEKQLKLALDAENGAQKNFHIREAMQMLNLTREE
ncbi:MULTISPECIES: hypothetical protein [Halorussus]|nr:hypothetical protein [Halorussus vallis]